MMGWSNPKTAMVYVKKSRLTSLSLALYLANVQRTNCPNPFPQTSVEKREAVKQKQGSKLGLVHCSKSPISKEEPESVSQLDDPDFVLATQDLIREIEAEESSVDNVVREVVVENKSLDKKEQVEVEQARVEGGSVNLVRQISSVDPRLSGILHNLQNTGNLNIHFHFDNQK